MVSKKPAPNTVPKAGTASKKKAPDKGIGSSPYRAPSWYMWNGLKLVMPNSPLTPEPEDGDEGVPRLVTDEQFREKALSQMRAFLELADRIERMDSSFKSYECLWIAGAVRAYASQIYLKPPRGRGAAPKIDPLGTVMRYIQLRRDHGLTKPGAIAKLEDELEVSGPAIGNVLKKYQEQVDLLEEAFYLKKLKRE